MADTLWEPFENNLQRWVDSLDGRIIRGVTTPEQEQQIIDNIRSTNPAGVPWATAEESPYVDGLAATVVIPPRNMDRALRTSAQNFEASKAIELSERYTMSTNESFI